MSGRQLWWLGVKHALPIVLGYIPVGIAYAVFAKQTGFSDFQIILMSLTSYSGAGQFLTVSMTASGAGLVAIAIGIFLINFRYFIMSACVFNRFERLSNSKRVLFSHLITDETFAIFTTADKKLITEAYFIGIFVTSYLSWILGAILGVLANSFLPLNLTLALGIALYALFIAIIVPGCRQDVRVCVMVIFTALLNIILTQFLQYSWATVIATLVGALGGALFIKKDNNAEVEHG